MPRDVGAIIVAAGRGTRLGAPVPKQYLSIAGVPMLLRALRPFASHPEVACVVLVLPAEDVAAPPDFLRGLDGAGLSLVAGGPERTDSVRAGLAKLATDCRIVLVHDAARPFTGRAVIDSVIAIARGGEGAVAAVRVSDTLKQAAADDATRVHHTVPREGLWRAQTPQGFPRAVLEDAYASQRADGSPSATDDAALVERTGVAVRLVPDSLRNLKVTTADDLAIAELLAGRPE